MAVPATAPTDAELVTRARAGDRAAVEELIGRHRDTAYRVALRITGDAADAEDVAQEALVRAWRSLASFRGDAAFSTWLYRIVTNTALKVVTRRRERPVAVVPDRALPAGFDPAAQVVDRERLAAVGVALRHLTPEQRACWVLREVEGLTYEELATVLDTSLAGVKGRLFRARADLAAALARYDNASAPAGWDNASAPAGWDNASAPAGWDNASAPAGWDKASAPAGWDKASAPAGWDGASAPAGWDKTEEPTT